VKITILDGHPDPDAARFVHALADAYAAGARQNGHQVRRIDVARTTFGLLSTKQEFESAEPEEAIRGAQADIAWCDHLVVLYPLWLGDVPARLKGVFEQVFRPGFAFAAARKGRFPTRLLAGRSARIVVTMGMPAVVYRWFFRAHSVKSLQRNVLGFCGFGPVRSLLIGTVENLTPARRDRYLQQMRALGRDAG
jgi:putative NADPH-quinone reductase